MSECVWEQTFPARRMVACTYRREDREAESPVVIDKGEGLLQKYTIHGEPCRDVLVFVGEDNSTWQYDTAVQFDAAVSPHARLDGAC